MYIENEKELESTKLELIGMKKELESTKLELTSMKKELKNYLN